MFISCETWEKSLDLGDLQLHPQVRKNNNSYAKTMLIKGDNMRIVKDKYSRSLNNLVSFIIVAL